MTVDIVNNEFNDNEQLKESWVEVFDSLVARTDFDYVKLVAVKVIQQMTDRKSAFSQRKLGTRLLGCLIKRCGEAAMDEDPLIRKIWMQLCRDSNYKIKLEAAIILKEYLSGNCLALLTSARLQQTYIPELVDMCSDEQTCIRIEVIEALSSVMEVVEVCKLESEVIPVILQIMQSNYDELVEKLAKFIGKLVYKMSTVADLHLKYKHPILAFFKALCVHKDESFRLTAACNLPCFYALFHKPQVSQPDQKSSETHLQLSEDGVYRTETGLTASTGYEDEELLKDSEVAKELGSQLDFPKTYLALAQDESALVRASVATSIHEALTLSWQSEDTSVLRETVLTLLKDESPEVMQALCENLDLILNTYASPSALKQFEVC